MTVKLGRLSRLRGSLINASNSRLVLSQNSAVSAAEFVHLVVVLREEVTVSTFVQGYAEGADVVAGFMQAFFGQLSIAGPFCMWTEGRRVVELNDVVGGDINFVCVMSVCPRSRPHRYQPVQSVVVGVAVAQVFSDMDPCGCLRSRSSRSTRRCHACRALRGPHFVQVLVFHRHCLSTV